MIQCPECGYPIPDGTSLCVRCGCTVKLLRPLTEEEQKKYRSQQEEDYKTIDPEDMYFSHGDGSRAGGSLFEELFRGFGHFGNFGHFTGGFGGSILNNFGGIIEQMLGFDGGEEQEEEDDEENYTYDALGYRVKKKQCETIVVRELECYDKHGKPADKKTKQKLDKENKKKKP